MDGKTGLVVTVRDKEWEVVERHDSPRHEGNKKKHLSNKELLSFFSFWLGVKVMSLDKLSGFI